LTFGEEASYFESNSDFDYSNFVNSKNCKLIYALKKAELKKYKNYLNVKFYEILYAKAK
jgi:hypothetical protein